MPNIRTYNAPLERLSPDNRGNSAYETAARRIGPLYTQAAEDVRTAGAAKARALKDNQWPFSIAELEASLDDIRARRGGGTGGSGGSGGGGGFKVSGDINSFFNSGKGAPGGSSSGKASKSSSGGISNRANAEIIGSAAGFTRLTRNLLAAPERTTKYAGDKTDLSAPDDLKIPGATGIGRDPLHPGRGDLGLPGEDEGIYPLPAANGPPSPIESGMSEFMRDYSASHGVYGQPLDSFGSGPQMDYSGSPPIPDVPDAGGGWRQYIPSFPWSNSSSAPSSETVASIPPAGDDGNYGGGGDF